MAEYNVGIFWYVKKKFLTAMESKEKSELSASTRIVDSDYSHFVKWDNLGKDYPYADFATYPRGRVMYNLDKDTYIVYADACIPDEQI